MKKLLRLGDGGRGGPRSRDEIYDLLGMRAVVMPRADLPPDQVCGGTAARFVSPPHDGFEADVGSQLRLRRTARARRTTARPLSLHMPHTRLGRTPEGAS